MGHPLDREHTDGRSQRRARTRLAIVEAHTAMLREGQLKPTAAQVAERAGVSVRTLWGAFGDMEGLLQATTSYWMSADDELRTLIDPYTPLPERIEAYCAERVRRLEGIAPGARSAQLMEPFSAALTASRRTHLGRAVEDAERTFAAELAACSDPDATRDALVASVSWNAWSLLRDDLDRSVEQAQRAMVVAVSALLS